MTTELTKEQRSALRSLERAFKKCADANLQFCGMDDGLHYATQEACDSEQSGMGYCPCANAQQDPCLNLHEIVGTVKDYAAYQDSGAW